MRLASTSDRVTRFENFVRGNQHPCAMARGVVASGTVRYGFYDALGDDNSAVRLRNDLCRALAEADENDNWSFVAIFECAAPDGEAGFERLLWAQLQAMHDVDRESCGWDSHVDSDPSSGKFSFSIGERAWYVIGLHPAASRIGRRFDHVALVFNPHSQFERLRERGKYDVIKRAIRTRDEKIQGSINPMLADHGERSEARQYSGRAVEDDWKCPFQPRGRSN